MKTRPRTARRAGGRDAAAASLPQVLTALRLHHPGADVSLVERAHAEAARWHAGQTRRSGDPYVTHCVAVAAVVADAGMPPAVVCAAMLHDITDTLCPPGRVGEYFGPDVARLVADVVAVKLVDLPVGGLGPGAARPTGRPTHEEAVLAIRLADRLHNMRTIAFLGPAKQHGKARETIDVFAPLARAAGLPDMGRELHDLSTAVLRPASSAVSARVLTLLTVLLPSAQRARWREEWHAELTCLPERGTRARFVLRVLLGAPRLSLTLRHRARWEGS
ncbi:HD domain-containing protein [Streptomyces sp. MBT33]|uniref:HD domain-containing protein n=1 Tax=Streptomyces sp. MBT33 TaxID=1488363 RepID=UPI00190D8239|nr:HD domain-containing protein [Streptomyces sp. MBT33]MBK3641929.1 bifunctional (p)ppGpp synthetase/guanosine-3',5'-bis(diphosphate) 3'-pyrophosphohydrolase [Streptomyces sp. MBT33]